MLALLLIACSSDPARAPSPQHPQAVEKPATPAPAPELVHVQASRLKLRATPDGEAVQSLGINARLRVLGREEGWLRVTSPDGTDGWVSEYFVAAERVTPEALQASLATTEDPKERLSLWQRAAALQPTDAAVLDGLAGAYDAVGDIWAAERVRKVMATTIERFDGWFPNQKDEVDAIRAGLAEAGDAATLVALWQRALAVTAAMAEPLNTRFSGYGEFIGGDPEPLFAQRLPWAELTYYAEGTWAALELSPAAWAMAAARTPEAWDDRLIALVVESYGNASGRGWASWQDRNWDYGGCSPLGSGLHKRLLLQTDALAGQAEVAEAVAAIRADVLSDIEQPHGPGEFPYCGGPSIEPTPVETLRAEAAQILAEVKLSREEKAMVERRSAAGFGLSD